jgi:hypothetical protein
MRNVVFFLLVSLSALYKAYVYIWNMISQILQETHFPEYGLHEPLDTPGLELGT